MNSAMNSGDVAGIAAAKKEWRQVGAALCGLTSRADRAGLDAALADQAAEYARGYAVACGATMILGYAALPDEADAGAFFRAWLDDGGGLAFPVWEGGPAMTLRRVRNFARDFSVGRGGILSPSADCPVVQPDEIGLAVVPGRFFSETCQRLGRGAGCYDALLAGRRMYRVGVAYDYQIMPRLPAGGADEEMDMVVTPSRVIINAKRGTGP